VGWQCWFEAVAAAAACLKKIAVLAVLEMLAFRRK
jgi:hypothetical protein